MEEVLIPLPNNLASWALMQVHLHMPEIWDLFFTRILTFGNIYLRFAAPLFAIFMTCTAFIDI